MGWYEYYELFEKYEEDLSRATARELDLARRENPNDAHHARVLAEKKYFENYKLSEVPDPARLTGGLIYKHVIGRDNPVRLHPRSELMDIQVQGEDFVAWFLVPLDKNPAREGAVSMLCFRVCVIATGDPIKFTPYLRYYKTVQDHNKEAWHLFINKSVRRLGIPD